jgi:hypothetical protein
VVNKKKTLLCVNIYTIHTHKKKKTVAAEGAAAASSCQ